MSSDMQLDRDQLATLRLLRNGKLLGNLIRTYRTQTPQQLLEIRAALQARDTAGIARIAHSLKSASFALGAIQMGRISTALESAAMQCDADQCDRLAVMLQEHFDTVLPDLLREEQA